MIQNLIYELYLFISDFLIDSRKAYKTSKKDHSFYNTVLLKKTDGF